MFLVFVVVYGEGVLAHILEQRIVHEVFLEMENLNEFYWFFLYFYKAKNVQIPPNHVQINK